MRSERFPTHTEEELQQEINLSVKLNLFTLFAIADCVAKQDPELAKVVDTAFGHAIRSAQLEIDKAKG